MPEETCVGTIGGIIGIIALVFAGVKTLNGIHNANFTFNSYEECLDES